MLVAFEVFLEKCNLFEARILTFKAISDQVRVHIGNGDVSKATEEFSRRGEQRRDAVNHPLSSAGAFFVQLAIETRRDESQKRESSLNCIEHTNKEICMAH